MAGVEDPALHYENVRAARRCVREGPGRGRPSTAVAVDRAPKNIYSPALAAFDHHRTAFHAGRGKVGDYARFLAPHGDGPEPGGLSRRWILKRGSISPAERERRRVLERLIAALSPEPSRRVVERGATLSRRGLTAGELTSDCDGPAPAGGPEGHAGLRGLPGLHRESRIDSTAPVAGRVDGRRAVGRTRPGPTEPERRLLALSE